MPLVREFDEYEIYLPFVEVGCCNFDANFITDAEANAGVAAYESIFGFHVFEVVEVCQVGDGDHAFAFVFDGFGPEAEAGGAADDGVEIFAHIVLEVFDLLVLVSAALCFHGFAFHIAAMAALLFHLFDGFYVVGEALLKDAVDQDIGVAADG